MFEAISPFSSRWLAVAVIWPSAFRHLAGDNTCHVCSMAEHIDQGFLIVFTEHGKIPMFQRLIERQILVFPEMGVIDVDARIHDCPDDIVTERGKRIASRVRFYRADGFRNQSLNGKVGPDPEYGPVRCLRRAGIARSFWFVLIVAANQFSNRAASKAAKRY